MSESVAGIIVGQGKRLDYIDGHTQRPDTPEEYVRQEISKSLVREYGYAKTDVEIEFTIRMGTRKPRADIVVFAPGDPHRQDRVRLIVECKAPDVQAADRKEGVGQLHSYMAACPNAAYGFWTNGRGGERFCFRRTEQDGVVKLDNEVADIPPAGIDELVEDRPKFDKLKPATSDALLFAFRRCHNYIAANQGLQKSLAFWELLKLIFCKIEDEHQQQVEFFAAPNEQHGENGPVKVVKRIELLFDKVKAEYDTIFKAAERIELKPQLLARLVGQLQMYSLLESDVDVKGRAYEEIVGSNLRGDRGEFFTPRNICQMAVAMLDPRDDQLVLDPACGTGGFLITALNYVTRRVELEETAKRGGNQRRAEKSIDDRVDGFVKRRIVGIDFNPELVKASKMNMVMNNDGEGGLYQANTLEYPVTWEQSLQKRKLMGSVDVLFTNPPFGSKLNVADASTLEQYDLGHVWHYDKMADVWKKTEQLQRSQPPEILFVERCVKFLKPGTGRTAIVLPDGVLGSPGLGYVREWILRNTRVLASIDLHADTFSPFVSVQTSILVLQRKTDEQIALETARGAIDDYEVFMAMANHIGHDKRGNKTYVRDEFGNEIPVDAVERIKDFTEDGTPFFREQMTRKFAEDDNTLETARAFHAWLSSQSN